MLLHDAFSWLAVPGHRDILTWLGGGISTFFGGCWAVLTYLRGSKKASQTDTSRPEAAPIANARASRGARVSQSVITHSGFSGVQVLLLLGVVLGAVVVIVALFTNDSSKAMNALGGPKLLSPPNKAPPAKVADQVVGDCSVGIGGNVSGGNFNISCPSRPASKIDENLLQRIQIGDTIESAEEILGKPSRRVGRTRVYELFDGSLTINLCPGPDGSTIVTEFVMLAGDSPRLPPKGLKFVPQSRFLTEEGVILGRSKLRDVFRLSSIDSCAKSGGGNSSSKFWYLSLACETSATRNETVYYEFGSDDIPGGIVPYGAYEYRLPKADIEHYTFTAYYAAVDKHNSVGFAASYEGTSSFFQAIGGGGQNDNTCSG